jgi:hypothetical protein
MNSNSNLKTNFHAPPVSYRPWTRWWWPGGAVELDELLREVRLFADTLFGGVEIQPFTAGINRQTINDPSSAIYDYDSPAYYEKLIAVLEEAKQQGLQIDLTMGSGWPAGGSFVPLEDNVDTLLYGEVTISRGVDMPVPAPIMPFAYAIFSPASTLPLLRGREWVQTLTYHPEATELVAVVAAKIVDNQRSPDPSVLTDTMNLDIDSTIDITQYVQNGHLQWNPPSDGEWQIVSIYTMPSGSRLLIAAVAEENYVVDPFDTQAITRYYNNWIGQHPELLAHAGGTLRALFSDSYEYFAQRMFADDLIETFRANRGYDVTPFLPAVFQPARDLHFFFFTGLPTAPDFSFGELSERIIHDYNLTVSDLFFKHWYSTSREWIEDQNLQFRQQGYNPPLDVMKAAGAASIPETEGGNPLWLKRVASGAHLYNHPIISAESFVFLPQGGFALTPQDYKQGIDLLMTAGVNHIIYHGTPYRWDESGYGEIGWSPFISPYGSNISSTISEADSFWKVQGEINLYVARLQVLLRQGNPDADLLVYLPVFDKPDDERFLSVVATLDASGYAWEWVNDDLISQAEWSEVGLRIGNMLFQGIVLPNVEALPVSTAQKLETLAQAGLPIAMFGQVPSRQPGYLDYIENDRVVSDYSHSIVNMPQNALMTDTEALTQYIQNLPHGAITYETNSSLCYIRRTLDDGKYLAFIRNTTDEATDFTLHIEPSLTHCYWFDAMTGNIHAFEQDMQTLTGRLKSFGSIAILCSPEEMFSTAELPSDNPIQEAVIHNTIPLTDWKLEVIGDDVPDGTFVTTTDVLEDWSKHEDLKYVSSVGTYTATLPVSDILQDKRYMLDLGVVFAVADVAINGQNVGQAIFSPYQVDITDHLVTGDNTLIIEVTPALRNRLLGKALAGDPEYRQFIGRPPFGNSNPIPSGLVGPVNVQIIEPNL